MDFLKIIKEQRKELTSIEKKEQIIPRELFNEAKRFLRYPNILTILGVRRCGKSIFSYLLAKGNSFGYINFDDERLFGVKTADLNKILQDFYTLYGDIDYVVLDELQNVDGWELFVNRLRRTKKVIITGSNSKLLSGELATHLTGRHIDIILTPFSFKEFLLWHNILPSKAYTTQEQAEMLKFLDKYFEIGGFPEAKKFGKVALSGIYNDIITKDILLRHKIKKIEEAQNFARYLVSNFGQEFTYQKLGNVLGMTSSITLARWLSFLQDAFLVFRLERFSFKLKQQFIAPKKIYCLDNGLINAIAYNFSENKGHLMENTVAVELLRKKYHDHWLEIYYWKDHQQREVDFVIKRGPKISSLIQVSNITRQNEIPEREVLSLLIASKALKCNDLMLITYDFESEQKIKGKKIKFIPLWKWLLT